MPWLALPDITLHYEEHGTGGPPLLLLHELGGSGETWRHVAGWLGAAHRVIALDLRGCGRSEKPTGDYGIEGLCADILATLDALEIRRTHVAGCAMGSIVALALAAAAPRRVGSVVVSAAAPGMTETARRYAGERARTVRAEGMRAVAETSARNSFPEGIAVPRAAAIAAYTARFLANDPAAYAALSEGLCRHTGDRIAFEQIVSPVLCLAGRLDFIWPPEVVESLHARLSDSRFAVLERAGHFPPLQDPAAYADAVLRFLEEHPLPAD